MDKKRLSRWKSTHVLNSLSLPLFLREINIRRIVFNGLFIVHDWSADACPRALTLGIHASVNDRWDAMFADADKKTMRPAAEGYYTSFEMFERCGTEDFFKEYA
jgi:hypothetical protein